MPEGVQEEGVLLESELQGAPLREDDRPGKHRTEEKKAGSVCFHGNFCLHGKQYPY